MGKKSAATRERILGQGLEMLGREGMAGVMLGQVAERVGMSKSGLFAHFRPKDDVQIGLLDHMARFLAPLIVEPAMKGPEGPPRLASLVRRWLGWPHRAGLPGGCPVAAAIFELDDVASPVRDKVVVLEADWRGLLGQLVRQAIDRGHLRDDFDVDRFVWELCGIYLGHHTAFRFLRHADAEPGHGRRSGPCGMVPGRRAASGLAA